MNRVMLDLGIIEIYWYSFFILLGVLTSILIIIKELKRENISTDKFLDMAFYAIITGIIGARVYYVLFNLPYYLKNITEIFMIWHGGLAIHGGLLGGLIYIIYFSRKENMNTLKILDIVVVGLIIGQAIGRWGNFFNSEAYGVITTKNHLESILIPKFIIDGMHINGNYYTPTFLYESTWNILGFIILNIIRRLKDLKVGRLTGIYLIWYSLGRFFIEGLRLDSLMLGNLKVAQLISILLFIIGLVLTFRKSNDIYHEKNKQFKEKNSIIFSR